MVHKVMLPKLGANLEEATIVRWLKAEGDFVRKGEPLLEVETSKALFEVETEADGILWKVLVSEGEEVFINDILAIIADKNENTSLIEKSISESILPKSEERYRKQIYEEWRLTKVPELSSGQLSKANITQGVRLTPSAKRIMREKGIDIEQINASFKKDVVTAEDIEEWIEKKKRVVIYGAGLGAKQTLEIVKFQDNIKIIGLIDDNLSIWGESRQGCKILGGFSYLVEHVGRKEVEGVILSFHSEIRRKIFNRIKDEIPDLDILSVMDARAIVCSNVATDEGVSIEAGAIVGAGTKIAKGAIVDMGAVVSHDCRIGPHSHLSPGCHLSGVVHLVENVLVGTGAAVNSTVTIGRNVIITPASGVMNDIPDDVVVSGIPAVVIGRSRRGR